MTKTTAESTLGINISTLKKFGYFINGGGLHSGTITWTWRLSGRKNNVGIVVNTEMSDITEESDYMKLSYTQTDRMSGEKESMDYKVPLVTTPCNYGGKRYWFICPLYKSERYCGRRVGMLYSVGKYFGCRHCSEIAYESQMKGGRLKGLSSVSEPQLERVRGEIKREYYGGKMTRKYKRYLRMEQRLNMDLFKVAGLFRKRYDG